MLPNSFFFPDIEIWTTISFIALLYTSVKKVAQKSLVNYEVRMFNVLQCIWHE